MCELRIDAENGVGMRMAENGKGIRWVSFGEVTISREWLSQGMLLDFHLQGIIGAPFSMTPYPIVLATEVMSSSSIGDIDVLLFRYSFR